MSSDSSAARLTLSLDDAPLLQVLHLLGNTGPARFRFGAPPDSVVSVRWRDEDPFASIDGLVGQAGLRLQRDANDYFLLPLVPGQDGLPTNGMWSQWIGPGAPPRAATSGPETALKVKLSGTLAGGGGKAPPRAANATGRQAGEREASLWRALAPIANAERTPGLAVTAAANAKGAQGIWLRCGVSLSVVPRGVRLMLESAQPLDLLVNGAPVARGWTGLRAFDIEPLLRSGPNILVVRLNEPVGSRSATPALRYEWIFDGGSAGRGLPGEIARPRD